MLTRLIATGLAAAQILLSSHALGDDTIKRAQELLSALGYEVGTPDGVAGKRTEAAIADAMDKYGQVYDGAISENEVAFLVRVAPAKLRVDFDASVSELPFLDAADINGDGRLDFVIAPRTDPYAQLGLDVVPADRIKDLIPTLPALIYSTPEGYAVQPFPEEARTNNTMSGKFLTNPTGTYFVLGRNGELGLPYQNRGERSLIFRIAASGTEISLTKVLQFTIPTTTAGIELWDFDADGYPEIFENNYNYISVEPKSDGSIIYSFGADEKLRRSGLQIVLDTNKPVNQARLLDIDGNGQVDFLAAAEIQKSYDGANLEAKTPGSYVLLNPFDTALGMTKPTYLAPPHFGKDQAGFSMIPFEAEGRTFLFEVSQEFLGHTGGGFRGYYLDAFELLPDGSITNVRKEVLAKAPESKSGGRNLLQRADIDFDGQDEIYLEMYSKRPQYLDWNGTSFQLKDSPSKDYVKPNYQGTLAILPDADLKCVRAVTYLEDVRGAKFVDVRLSACTRVEP